jgi:sn-glycerol 3-phosphate transport system substrate-binding protein
MRSRTRTWIVARLVAVLAAFALVAAACGGGDDDGGGGGGAAAGDLPSCPVDALAGATKPVDITVWHAFNDRVGPPFVDLVNEFNSSQDEVEVKLVAQGSYKDNFQKFKAGLESGDLPDMVQIEDTGTQQMIDTGVVLPAESCIEADDYDTSAYLPRILDYYSAKDVLYPAYFNVSNPILYFNETAFTRAGLDPANPPATLAELRSASEQLKAAGYPYGFALKTDPWFLEQWSAKGGATYVDEENGRRERADAVTWDETAQEIFDWMADMVDSGLAITSPNEGPGEIDHFLALREGRAGMTIDTSAALGAITAVIESGEGGNVVLGNGAMPGPEGDGGVLVGGGAFYISNRSSDEKQAAAWKLAKFLGEPENVAYFSAGTGYVPIREDAVGDADLQARWAETPGFQIAYDQLTEGPDNVATAGPLIGDYQGVRDAVLAAMEQMFTQDKAPKPALDDARTRADGAIEEYNSRIGG